MLYPWLQVAEGVALNNVAATATSSYIEPTLASGVDCTFSGCYASTVFPNSFLSITTLAIKPTPCTVGKDNSKEVTVLPFMVIASMQGKFSMYCN